MLFAIDARLEDYRTERATAMRIQAQSVVEPYRFADEVTATLALVAPSTHLFGGPSPITQTVALIQNGHNTYTLHSPYALPTGMYYVTVQVGDDTQFLRPIWIQEFRRTVPRRNSDRSRPTLDSPPHKRNCVIRIASTCCCSGPSLA